MEPFLHRSYLGWVRDLATHPKPTHPSPADKWPNVAIDDDLLADYEQTFAVLQKAGFNEIVLWGLFTSRNWLPDVEHTIDEARAGQVRHLIAQGHAHGLKVLYGGGLYSWGFENIIAAHREVAGGTSETVMRPLHPLAWEFQRRIFDFVLSFPFDGISMQSGDLGRNDSPETAVWSDIQYHAFLTDKAARYLKANYPDKMLAVSGWGLNFGDPADLPFILQMTRDLTYLVDVQDSAAPWRPQMIEAIRPCCYGSTGSPNVEPPLHWARDRWFLPILKRMVIQMQTIHAQGARAVETYMRVLANPGEEAALRVAGAVELQPDRAWDDITREVLNDIYRPKTPPAHARLLGLFERAEDSYYDNSDVAPADIVRVEPLVGDRIGHATYLVDHMAAAQLAAYGNELRALRAEAAALEPLVENAAQMQLIGRCIENSLLDVGRAQRGSSF